LVAFTLVESETVSESGVVSRDLFLTTSLTLGVEVGVAWLARSTGPAFVEVWVSALTIEGIESSGFSRDLLLTTILVLGVVGVTSLGRSCAFVDSETVSESGVGSGGLFLITSLILGVGVGFASLGRPSALEFVLVL
jgi:hypothetical protein